LPKIKFNTHKIKILLYPSVEKKILHYRQKHIYDKEKGGIILGKLIPSQDTLIITDLIPSNNVYNNRINIQLDTQELQKIIDKKWEESNGKITYLGDWHTHPCENPKPSITDKITFFKNYHQSKIDQNILIYIILGSKEDNYIAIHNGYRLQKKETFLYPKFNT
jgi:integrative and conjugative element protein (TIGR02256 family)